jgi:hypothetical protein
MDFESAGRGDESLAKIAVLIRKLVGRHMRNQPVLLARDPLPGTAARTQHQDKWRQYGNIECQITTCS